MMKKTLLLLAAAFLFCFAIAWSQEGPERKPGGPDKDRMERHLAMLKEKLKLTDAQTSQVKTILDETRKEATTNREKNMGNPEQADKMRGERRKATTDKIMTVLTDEQKKEFKKMEEERGKDGPPPNRDMNRQGTRRGPGGPGGPGRSK